MYGAYHTSLIIFSEKYVQDLSIAKDVVQSVFIKVWEKEVVFIHENSIKSYLYTAVRNKSLDYLKSKDLSVNHVLLVIDFSGHLMRIELIVLIILMTHIHLLETLQLARDLIIHKLGKKLNHFLKKMVIHLSIDIL